MWDTGRGLLPGWDNVLRITPRRPAGTLHAAAAGSHVQAVPVPCPARVTLSQRTVLALHAAVAVTAGTVLGCA